MWSIDSICKLEMSYWVTAAVNKYQCAGKLAEDTKGAFKMYQLKKKNDTAMINENQQKTNKFTKHYIEIYQILILTNIWQKIKYEIMQLIITADYQAWSFEKHIHNVTGLNMFVTSFEHLI